MKHKIHRRYELSLTDVQTAVLYWLHHSMDKPTPEKGDAVQPASGGAMIVEWEDVIDD